MRASSRAWSVSMRSARTGRWASMAGWTDASSCSAWVAEQVDQVVDPAGQRRCGRPGRPDRCGRPRTVAPNSSARMPLWMSR